VEIRVLAINQFVLKIGLLLVVTFRMHLHVSSSDFSVLSCSKINAKSDRYTLLTLYDWTKRNTMPWGVLVKFYLSDI